MIYDHNHAWYLNLWCLFLAPATLAMSKRLPKAIKIDQVMYMCIGVLLMNILN